LLCYWFSGTESEEWNYAVTMSPTNIKSDQYMCHSVRVPANAKAIIGFSPVVMNRTAHHIIVHGCSGVRHEGSYSCVQMDGSCSGPQIMYAWAHDAPDFKLPHNVGFSTKPFNYIQLEIHFGTLNNQPIQPATGVELTLSSIDMPHFASLILLASSTNKIIQGHTPQYELSESCHYNSREPFHAFAYRTHSHEAGIRIWAKSIDTAGNERLLGDRNPHLPQSFVLMEKEIIINMQDTLDAHCIYNTTGLDRIKIGAGMHDEMCNFYIMGYYSQYHATLICSNGRLF